MKKFALYASFIIAIFVALFLVSCWPYTYRYKLIIAAVVDGETVSASSVIEVAMTSQLQLNPDRAGYHFDVYGDAVYLDSATAEMSLQRYDSGQAEELTFSVSSRRKSSVPTMAWVSGRVIQVRTKLGLSRPKIFPSS